MLIAGLRERGAHVDMKVLLINTIRFSWEVCSVFRVQGWRARGSAAVCARFCLHNADFNILPFSVLSWRGPKKKKAVSTAELIFAVYREYTAILCPRKANLAGVTRGDNVSLSNVLSQKDNDTSR